MKRPSNLGHVARYREWPFLTASFLTFLPRSGALATGTEGTRREPLWGWGPGVQSRPPAPLTQLQEPALAVRVEERVCQVIAVVLRDLERLILNAFVQIL